MNRIKIIGHRGAAGLEPENTLRSFKKSLALGVDEIELDVLESRDGQIVVIHDDKLDRTTNGHGNVKNFTLAKLKNLNAGKGEKIPTLKEVFDLLKKYPKAIVNVEIKKTGYEKKVADLIKKYKFYHRAVVISFLPKAIKKIKALDKVIKTGLDVGRSFDPQKISRKLKSDVLLPKYTLVNAQNLSVSRKLGFKVIVWTVDQPDDIKKMIRLGVDGIVTNYPDRALKILKP